MFTAYVVVAVLTAAANTVFAVNDFLRAQWVLDNMSKVGLPQSWVVPLGVPKVAGALGLLVGIGVPLIGVAAAGGLVLFFVGAIITHRRARAGGYQYPGAFLLLAVGSLVLGVASA